MESISSEEIQIAPVHAKVQISILLPSYLIFSGVAGAMEQLNVSGTQVSEKLRLLLLPPWGGWDLS